LYFSDSLFHGTLDFQVSSSSCAQHFSHFGFYDTMDYFVFLPLQLFDLSILPVLFELDIVLDAVSID
jgi:hypothetical protein